MKNRVYIAIDLKSFYASVECIERGLDPMTTNLVVADASRTEKTICLAVSPSLKAYGIPGRPRLFEVVQKARKLGIDYITAPPQMALYLEYSARIYQIYLKYAAPEDIHVYSIDEVLIDITSYLKMNETTPKVFTKTIIQDIFETTGITATGGIGTNLYLCKVAMDIVAKHIRPDEDGVRIAELDEQTYREKLWSHRPLTDFWRVGRGYAKKLEAQGLFTMGDIARCSLGKPEEYFNEELLYQMFGINAELLIDHAWGYEPCTMEAIKAYQPESNSIGSGQVLHCAYDFLQTRLVVAEMIDLLSLDLVDKGLVTDQIVLTIGYDIENLTDPLRKRAYHGPVKADHYGRLVPKHAHGTENLSFPTSSTRLLTEAVLTLFDRIVDPKLLIRRINLTANHVVKEGESIPETTYEQLDLFTDCEAAEQEKKQENALLEKEKKMQQAVLDIKKKYGKNAILKGMNLQEGATTIDRNQQIGGHKA